MSPICGLDFGESKYIALMDPLLAEPEPRLTSAQQLP